MREMDQNPVDILLAEDNEDDIVFITDSFEEANFANVMHVVRDGVEALKFLRREPPYENEKQVGLVLLDINMPRKTGFQVLEEIKKDPNLKRLPVVMLTTSQRDEDIIKSFDSGACSYIQKPVDFDKMRAIAQHFSLYWTLVSCTPPNP